MEEIIGIILGGIIWFAIARKKGSVKMQRIAIISCASLLLTTLFGVIGLLIAIVAVVGYILVEKHLKDDSKSEKNNEADDSKSVNKNEADDSKSVNKNEADENKTIEQSSIDRKDEKRKDKTIQAETTIIQSSPPKTLNEILIMVAFFMVFVFLLILILCVMVQ